MGKGFKIGDRVVTVFDINYDDGTSVPRGTLGTVVYDAVDFVDVRLDGSTLPDVIHKDYLKLAPKTKKKKKTPKNKHAGSSFDSFLKEEEMTKPSKLEKERDQLLKDRDTLIEIVEEVLSDDAMGFLEFESWIRQARDTLKDIKSRYVLE